MSVATVSVSATSAMQQKKPIIWWSIDGIIKKEVIEVIKNPNFPSDLVGIKCGRDIYEDEEFGPRAIREFQETYGVPVFDDAKIIEIPNKVIKIAKQHITAAHPYMINVMAGICSNGFYPDCKNLPTPEEGKKLEFDALHQFAELCAENDVRSCGVTVLTSKTPGLISKEYGGDTETVEATSVVDTYATMMQNCGLTDIVCSPAEIKYVSSYFDLTLNTPGIRKAGDSADDQARIDTPYNAVYNAGLDAKGESPIRLVIGRSIWQPGQPYDMALENIKNIIAEIERAKADLRN